MTQPDQPVRLLYAHEVARLFRVNSKTVRRWAVKGLIKSVRTPAGQCRYREADVLELLRDCGI